MDQLDSFLWEYQAALYILSNVEIKCNNYLYTIFSIYRRITFEIIRLITVSSNQYQRIENIYTWYWQHPRNFIFVVIVIVL